MDERELTDVQIIERLSAMHKAHSKDPYTLCSGTIHDFDLDHPDIESLFKLQPRLFEICKLRGERWANL